MALRPEAPFAVRYVSLAAAQPMPRHALGVIGYGTGRPSFLAAGCPFVAPPLVPTSGEPMLEIWSAPAPCRPLRVGPVNGACGEDLAFATVTIDEAGRSFEDAVEAAYLALFDFLDVAGFAAPLRFWNYLTGITQEQDGMERYRRFNIGRHRAFAARLGQPLPPTASGVGGAGGASTVYMLAAREPAQPVENPRQVSAYEYPPIYGPRSPSFSRAAIHALHGTRTLFVSGTASIVGHETRHAGDLPGQLAETIANLRVLTEAAERTAAGPLGGDWAFKIYLHDPRDRAVVDRALQTAFGPDSQRLFLAGDLCRVELLVEIEAMRHAGPGIAP